MSRKPGTPDDLWLETPVCHVEEERGLRPVSGSPSQCSAHLRPHFLEMSCREEMGLLTVGALPVEDRGCHGCLPFFRDGEGPYPSGGRLERMELFVKHGCLSP